VAAHLQHAIDYETSRAALCSWNPLAAVVGHQHAVAEVGSSIGDRPDHGAASKQSDLAGAVQTAHEALVVRGWTWQQGGR